MVDKVHTFVVAEMDTPRGPSYELVYEGPDAEPPDLLDKSVRVRILVGRGHVLATTPE